MQENISPNVIRKVAGQLRKLSESPIDGVKIILNESDITDIQAVIEGPGEADSSGDTVYKDESGTTDAALPLLPS